jgi:serine/threonine-protein kinase
MTAQAHLLGGRYQVGELLGYGGMAEVHRGRDLRLGRDVAIKMLRTDLARDRTFQERFRREAQNAAALNHPAIVAVYDTGEERSPTGERLPFIIMEFVNGRTLKEVLTAEGRLMPQRALEIIAEICAALEFSHRHSIIHRDIKPGNVMLTQNGQIKVMDFGIARALASGATTMTQTSAVIGTAQYLSPEQARGEAVDARSDVYAAGCVLFELLCGHPPFVGDSPVSVAYQHVREDPRAPSEINPDVNADLDAVVLKALAKNPLNRYQSAAEMRADALRAAAGRPVLATPVLRQDETAALAQPEATRPLGAVGGRPVAARVGDPRRRRASAWMIAGFSGLAVLAVIALIVGLMMSAKGQDQIGVPNVVGQDKASAETLILDKGLVATSELKEQEDCDEGKVIAQSPQAESLADKGATVNITLCAGPGSVVVPDIERGSTKASAEDKLEGVGLKVRFEQVDSGLSKNTVVRVPRAGQTVDKGTTIVVEISRENMGTVPDVVGDSQSLAESRLKDAGFNVTVRNGDTVPADQAGKVQRQSPSGGESRIIGSTVIIYVSVPKAVVDPTTSPTADPSPNPTSTS